MADINAVWHEFDDQPDMLARGWTLRDPEKEYGIPYDSKRLHEHGALVVGGAGISYRLTVAQDPAFAHGRYLQLRLEPDNPVDPNAVAIWDAECRLQIGYVPADHAPDVARRLLAHERLYALCLMEFVSVVSGERRGIRLLIAPWHSGSTSRPEMQLLKLPPGRTKASIMSSQSASRANSPISCKQDGW